MKTLSITNTATKTRQKPVLVLYRTHLRSIRYTMDWMAEHEALTNTLLASLIVLLVLLTLKSV